jgi:hypothetical protein
MVMVESCAIDSTLGQTLWSDVLKYLALARWWRLHYRRYRNRLLVSPLLPLICSWCATGLSRDRIDARWFAASNIRN